MVKSIANKYENYFFLFYLLSHLSHLSFSRVRTLAMANRSHKRAGLEWFDRLEIRLGCPGGRGDGGDLVELLTIGRRGRQRREYD
jgi:hypothetical protein